ncbi:MAG: DUF1294 domain-containing protein [Eubacteriales bacterium]
MAEKVYSMLPVLIPAAYLAVISVVPVAVTVYDKWAAKHRTDRRIRESSLLAFSVLGGSAAMFVTMLIIRHKTKHPKFMIGIPVIMAVQAALVWFAVKYLHINIVL